MKKCTCSNPTPVRHTARRPLALLLALMLVFTLVPTMALAGDYTGHWAEESIDKAVQKGWFIDGDNTRPAATITRAEFVTMVNRMMGYTGSADLSAFPDVNPGDWYHDAFATAVANEYIEGANGKLNPRDSITRNEAVAILVRIAGFETGDTTALANVPDADTIDDWAEPYAAAAVRHGLIGGMNGLFNGTANITRAETAVLLVRLDENVRVYGFKGSYTGSAQTVIVQAAGVTLQNYTVAGNLTIDKAVGDGEVNLNKVKVGGKLNIEGGGANSVYITESEIAEIIVTKNEVRVVLQDGSTVTHTDLAGSDSAIVVSGGATVTNITVREDATGVTLNVSGTVGEITIAGTDTTVTTTETATVATVVVNANNAKVEGAGHVTDVKVESGSGTTVITSGSNVNVGADAGAVTTGDGTIDPGTTGRSKPDGGNTGGTGDQPGSEAVAVNVAVTGGTLTSAGTTVYAVGDTLTAATDPAGAAGTWSWNGTGDTTDAATYTIAAGDEDKTLKVTFTPNDPTQYKAAEATVSTGKLFTKADTPAALTSALGEGKTSILITATLGVDDATKLGTNDGYTNYNVKTDNTTLMQTPGVTIYGNFTIGSATKVDGVTFNGLTIVTPTIPGSPSATGWKPFLYAIGGLTDEVTIKNCSISVSEEKVNGGPYSTFNWVYRGISLAPAAAAAEGVTYDFTGTAITGNVIDDNMNGLTGIMVSSSGYANEKSNWNTRYPGVIMPTTFGMADDTEATALLEKFAHTVNGTLSSVETAYCVSPQSGGWVLVELSELTA